MSVVAFYSAKGAPGVTTAAMLAASLWPGRALLVDADAEGGDVGLRLSTGYGRPLDLGRGLLSLLPLARRHVGPGALLTHAQTAAGGTEVVVGLSGPEQAAAAGPAWANLGQACVELLSHDVLVDAGRLGPRSTVLPLVQAADLAVCVLPASVSGVVHARERIRALTPLLARGDGIGPRAAVLVRAGTATGAERDVADALALLQAALPDLLVLGWLPHDPEGAGVFDGRPVGRPERTLLVRAGVEVVARAADAVHPLAPEAPAAPAAAPAPDAAGAADERERVGVTAAPAAVTLTEPTPAAAPADPSVPGAAGGRRRAPGGRVGRRRRETA